MLSFYHDLHSDLIIVFHFLMHAGAFVKVTRGYCHASIAVLYPACLHVSVAIIVLICKSAMFTICF